ncbi:MAG: hypothetical protein AAF702_49485 [Chloroflexota bacterium]
MCFDDILQGLYYYPKKTALGYDAPDEKILIRAFLNDGWFLITSPSVYNVLGIGTTQLYTQTVIYNHKRQGQVTLGNRAFSDNLTFAEDSNARPFIYAI